MGEALQQRVESVIHPFGYHVENFLSVKGGWTFQIKDSNFVDGIEDEEYYNIFLKDVTDPTLSKLAANLGITQ